MGAYNSTHNGWNVFLWKYTGRLREPIHRKRWLNKFSNNLLTFRKKASPKQSDLDQIGSNYSQKLFCWNWCSRANWKCLLFTLRVVSFFWRHPWKKLLYWLKKKAKKILTIIINIIIPWAQMFCIWSLSLIKNNNLAFIIISSRLSHLCLGMDTNKNTTDNMITNYLWNDV